MSITAKVKKRVIDTGRIFDVLVQGENRSHTIIFAIPNETMVVSGSEVFLKDCYFYLLYKRKGDAVPQIPLLLTKTYDSSTDTISASFEPTSYFTEKEGALEVQVFACSTEESFITGDVDIEDIALWTTFAAQISISKSQLKNSQTIVAEDMFTKGIAEMSAYLESGSEEADAAEEFASDAEEFAKGTRSDGETVPHASTSSTDNAKAYKNLAKDWACKIGGAVEGVEMSAKVYAASSQTYATESQQWANKMDGKVLGTDYSAKYYAAESKTSEQKASEWAEKETAVETGKYSAKHWAGEAEDSKEKAQEWAEKETAVETGQYSAKYWAGQAHAEFEALDTYVDETLKPALDDYEEAKEGELDDHTDDKKDDLDTYEGAKETELNTYTGTKKTDLDTYTGAKKGELDSYVTNTNKPALDSYTNNTLKPALLAYEQTQEGTLNTYTGTKKTELDSYVTNTSKPSIDDYIDDEKKPEIDAYVEEVEGQLAEDVKDLKSQVNVVSAEVENINAILEGEADVTNTDPAEGESLLAQSRLIHHANLLPNGSFGRVGARSVTWNQLVKNGNFVEGSGGTQYWAPYSNTRSSISASNGVLTQTFLTSGSYAYEYGLGQASVIEDSTHKYLIGFYVEASFATALRVEIGGSSSYDTDTLTANSKTFVCVVCNAYSYNKNLLIYPLTVSSASGETLKYQNFMIFDLTTMNMASITAGQFRALFPASYYPNDAGSIFNLNPSGFRIREINLWDEQTQGGYYNASGVLVSRTDQLCTLNKIGIKPNTAYYFKSPNPTQGNFCFYDANENFLSRVDSTATFTSPSNAYYLNVSFGSQYGATYNHDVCINVSDSQNGTYTPYHAPKTLTLPEPVTGKSAGSVHQIYYPETGEMTEPIGSVDAGSLTYSMGTSSGFNFFYATVTGVPVSGTDSVNLLCVGYVASASFGQGNMWLNNGRVFFVDNNYNNENAFKSAMSGKPLYFELATPQPQLTGNRPCNSRHDRNRGRWSYRGSTDSGNQDRFFLHHRLHEHLKGEIKMPNIEKLRKANMNQAYPKEVNDEMGKRHPYGDELALIRKEIHHIEMALNIAPTMEFADYYNEAETTKADVKERFK